MPLLKTCASILSQHRGRKTGLACSFHYIALRNNNFIIPIMGEVKPQKDFEPIYIGSLTGKSLEQFSKEESRLSGKLGLKEITDSKNKIEIRLYGGSSLSRLFSCTILYFDTTFKISKINGIEIPDFTNFSSRVEYHLEEMNTIDSTKVQMIFEKLVANGIFSLPEKSKNEIFEEYNPKMLTSKGLTKAHTLLINDGGGYTLEYKVDNLFNRIRFSNPHDYSEFYPDNQIFRRQAAIVTALRI
jgi:hypothetical protein